MWTELLSLLIRRVLIIVLGNAVIVQFLGPDVVTYLLGDGVVAQIVAVVGTLALFVWSVRHKLLERVGLKVAASGSPTTVAEVKQEVKAMPTVEKLATAFEPETKR